MCLTGGKITVALVTAHLPLRKAAGALQQSEIVRVGLLLADFLNSRFISSPRIAVAGLNPHAGESGKLGCEEIEIIAPAVAELNRLLLTSHQSQGALLAPILPTPSSTVRLKMNSMRYSACITIRD